MLAPSASRPRELATLADALADAAGRFGTPVYVVDLDSVARAAADVRAAFPEPWQLQYSLKANDLPAITAFLQQLGWGANVVSTGEWRSARKAGVPAADVTFEGIGKTDAELRTAVIATAEHEAPRWLAVESAAEAHRLAELAAQHRLGHDGRPPIDVLLRLNPQVHPETRIEFAVGSGSSKFGMDIAEIRELVTGGVFDHNGLRLRGVHVHIGSDLRDVRAYAAAGVRAARLLAEIAAVFDTADTIDFGGGFPPARPDSPTPQDFFDALISALHAAGLALPARPAIEPGRYLVGDSGWLVGSVLHARARGGMPQQIVLDVGMTEFIRPALYGSRHAVVALGHDADAVDTAVEGPVCESTDTFGTHPLPRMQRGELVAIEGAGAYGASFTSRYNGRPAPAEALLWPDGRLERADRQRLDVTPIADGYAARAGQDGAHDTDESKFTAAADSRHARRSDPR
ncbi:MAG: hypothetical protein DLM56_07735 [Pseudonocardiales bacterium]|nr:MAG: hypothetical protein DLM56_07735 [Pseudonocardiales bacterium]